MQYWLCCSCHPHKKEHMMRPTGGQHRGSKYSTSRKKPRKPPPIKVPKLSLEELKTKTNSEVLVGERSYGKVYHTVLDNGKEVAIRKLDVPSEDKRNEFLTQVSMVSNLKHENFVEMLGYCVEENMHLLVYEYATVGSLHYILHVKKGVQGAESSLPLDWTQRLRIALDAAKGLQYLHKEVQPPIIHCDIRSSNVLLFEGFKAKIADYNLLNRASDVATRLRSIRDSGTYDYHAPEFAAAGQLTEKSDVYSFGVVLLELLTGRKTMDTELPKEQQNLVTWATPRLRKDEFRQCVDPNLKTYSIRGAAKLAALAALCVQHDVEFRPYMSNVVKILSSILKDSSPPPPDAPPPQPPNA